MAESIKSICALAIICGAALGLTPEGRVRQIMKILTAAVLLLVIIKPLVAFDYRAYARELALISQKEHELITGAKEMSSSLSRLVIQQECETYIEDKAVELGLELNEVSVFMHWDDEGFWIPSSAKLKGNFSRSDRNKLGEILEAELGIPVQRQEWSISGE